MKKNTRWHPKACTWTGEGSKFSAPGVCSACDFIMRSKITRNTFRGKLGLDDKDKAMFCDSGIKWAKCTKHTNPSCACGKLVLNATA